MGYKHKTKTGKTDTTTVDDKNEYFEEITEFEETIFEPEPEPTPKKDPLFFYQKPAPPPPPNEYEIDVDGDQIPELKVSFTKKGDTKMIMKVVYTPTEDLKDSKNSVSLEFDYIGDFSIKHQDPSDGHTPYTFYLSQPDYKKVFYANQQQWPTPTDSEVLEDYIKQQTGVTRDTTKPTKGNNKKLEASLITIQFNEEGGKYSYTIKHLLDKDAKVEKTLNIDGHDFETFDTRREKGLQRGVVRDETPKRDKKKQAEDRSVSSYTIPIEVGKIGEPGCETDHNKHKLTLTIQKSFEDNGLAAISLSKWSGTRLVPIPGKFADVARPKVTENANHLELLFEGKKYNTTLRIHQRYLMLQQTNSKGTKDEIFTVNVYSGALPANKSDVISGSEDYFGTAIHYKIQHINGRYKGYHNKADNVTSKSEFHQNATEDARAKIGNQASSKSQDEEKLNIKLQETQLIGQAFKGKMFKDGHGQDISGDDVFMSYLDLIIAVERARSFKDDNDKFTNIEKLAVLTNAQHKAIIFWVNVYNIMKHIIPDSIYDHADFKPLPKRGSVTVLDISKMSHHSKKDARVSLGVSLRGLSEYIGEHDWTNIDKAMKLFHEFLEASAIEQNSLKLDEIYNKKTKGKKLTEEQKEELNGEKESIKASMASQFTLSSRYKAFLNEKKPPNEVYRAKAMFYPEYLNVGKDKKPTHIELPLYYYQKDGEWHLISLVSKTTGKLFNATKYAVKPGETHPPDEMFASLDSDDHLPKGLMYYETHDGHSNQISINSDTAWWKYAGYVALALFVIGLAITGVGALAGGAIAGIGSASLAGEVFFAAGVIGAAGAMGSMIDENARGSTTVKSFTVNLLDIAGAFIGGVKLFKGASLIKAANASKKVANTGGLLSKIGLKPLTGRHYYLLLETLDLGVDGTMVLIGTADGFMQILSILDGPGSMSKKMGEVARILPFIALQGGIFMGTVKGRVKGIDDAAKNKIIGGLNLKSAGKTEGSDVKAAESIDPKKAPELAKLQGSGEVFSRDSINYVLGLIRHPQEFESIAQAISKMDKARLKALCARFSERNVLYALYVFDGNFVQAYRHLRQHSTTFGDKGVGAYTNTLVYERFKGLEFDGLNNTKKSYQTKANKAQLELKDVNRKYGEAIGKQKSENKHWNEANKQLEDLKSSQDKTVKRLDEIPDEIRKAEKTLASNEAEAESFGKFAKDPTLSTAKQVDNWQGQKAEELAKANEALAGLNKKVETQAKEIVAKQGAFVEKQNDAAVWFYKDLLQKRNQLKNSNDPKLPEKMQELDAKEAAFIKKQQEEADAFARAQNDRERSLSAMRERLIKQEEVVKRATEKDSEYTRAAKVIKENIALREELAQLHAERKRLLAIVQELETNIQNLRTQMVKKRGRNLTLERQINEYTARRKQQEERIVKADIAIAKIEKKLATFAKEESRYTLDVQNEIKGKLGEERIQQLLEKNVAPKDSEQLKQFIEVQKQQVEAQVKQQQQAVDLAEQKALEIEGLDTKKTALLAEQKKLFGRQLQFRPSNIYSGAKTKKGKKNRRKSGGWPKVQSKRDKLKNIMNRLGEIDVELNNIKNQRVRAEQSIESAKAQKTAADAKKAQEEAKLDTYERFYQLQKSIAEGKQNLDKTKEEFYKLKTELTQTMSKQAQVDAEIAEYRTHIKTGIDKKVATLAGEKKDAQKKSNRANKRLSDIERIYNQAKLMQANAKEQAMLANAKKQSEAARASRMIAVLNMLKKVVQELKTPGKAAKTAGKAITTEASLPVLKAWWKIAKISRKLMNPAKGKEAKALTQQEAYVLLECEQLENLLKKRISGASDTLPNDEAKLWKLWFETLENTGQSNYTSDRWKRIQENMLAVQKENKIIEKHAADLKKVEDDMSKFTPLELSEDLLPDELLFLQELDSQDNDSNKIYTEKERKAIIEMIKQMTPSTDDKE